MSTFKLPPVYAETLFRMLDATTVVDSLTVHKVLEKHEWFFEGGTFGTRSTALPEGTVVMEETSETELPHGWTYDIAKDMMRKAEKEADPYAGEEPEPKPPECLAEILRVRQNQRPTTRRAGKAWAAIFAFSIADERRIRTGMQAVYTIAEAILTDVHEKGNFPTALGKFRKVRNLAEEVTMGSSFGAELLMTKLKDNYNVAMNMMESYRIPEMNAAETDVKHILMIMATAEESADMKEMMDEVDDAFDVDTEEFADTVDFLSFSVEARRIGRTELHVFPKAVVFRTARHSYVLGMSDWRKVIILITGFRNYVAGCCADACTGSVQKVANASRTVSAVYRIFRSAVSVGARLEPGKHIEMAKMYKTMLSVTKARIAGERAAKHAEELMADLKAFGVYDEAKEEMVEALGIVRSLAPKGALAAAKVFRLMPPPDVWMATALLHRWEKASIVRNVDEALLEPLEEAITEVILTALLHSKSVKLELKDEEARPVWWADYLAGKYDKVPKRDIANFVKTDGIVSMVDRSRYDAAVWKDSALGLDTMELAMSDDELKDMRNMLTRMLFDESCPMPDAVAEIIEEINAVMLKPESHKERIAYMNNLMSRFRQSRTEATVSKVMATHPSFAPVKTGSERDIIFEEMSAPPPSPLTVNMMPQYAGDYWVSLYYSFDITGWSENMALNVQTTSHKVWDRLTGTKDFSATTANHYKSKVYMNNGGVKAWYTNGGANFEGYNGKEMTTLHIAIMTLAVRELRRRKPNVPTTMLKIMLQAYIDDGVCRMTLPSRIAEDVFREWENVVSDTWSSYGFKIEAKKSFPSYFYFEFLGEEFYAGRQLASGTKAAMRITAEPFEYWESLPDRTAKIASACRGASTSGMDSIGAMIIQSVFCSMEIAKWVDVHDATASAFWTIAPRALGGLGVPALIPQSCNASGSGTEEAMAALWAWARSGTNPAVKKAYLALIRKGMAERTPVEVLSVPLGGVAEDGVMTVNPLSFTVSNGLKKLSEQGKLSSLGKAMIELGDAKSQENFAEAVVQMAKGEVLQEAALRDLLDGTLQPIHRAFVTRFEKEATFLRVSSRRALRRISRKARSDALHSHAKMHTAITPGFSMMYSRRYYK